MISENYVFKFYHAPHMELDFIEPNLSLQKVVILEIMQEKDSYVCEKYRHDKTKLLSFLKSAFKTYWETCFQHQTTKDLSLA